MLAFNARNRGSAIAGIWGSVLHFKKEKSRPLTLVVREIKSLGLQIRSYGLDGCAELAGSCGLISGLDRDVYLHSKSRRSLL